MFGGTVKFTKTSFEADVTGMIKTGWRLPSAVPSCPCVRSFLRGLPAGRIPA